MQTTSPAVGAPIEAPVRPHLTVEFDHVGDALDDIADLCEHWKRNRERGRMPHALRAALLMSMRDTLAMHDAKIKQARGDALKSLADELDAIAIEEARAGKSGAQISTVARGLRGIAERGPWG